MTDSGMTLVYITFDNQKAAKDLARQLVEKKLAACCNLLSGMESIYQWKGQIEESSEFILLAKTSRERFADLKAFVEHHHSYECPCILSLAIEDGSEPYLNWLRDNLRT